MKLRSGVPFSFLLAALLLAMFTETRLSAAEPANWLSWERLPDLPDQLGVAGPYVGLHDEALIVAGGANFPQQPYWENPKVWHNEAWVLTKTPQGAYRWQGDLTIDQPMAYGSSVSTDSGIVCIGGDDGQQISDRCYLLKWNSQEQKLEQQPLPSLPERRAYGAATAIDSVVYMSCGQSDRTLASATNSLWRLDLSKPAPSWERLPDLPGPTRAFHYLVAQHNGFRNTVHLFGGRCKDGKRPNEDAIVALVDHYEFDPDANSWRLRAELPTPRMAGAAVAMGQTHIAVLTGADGSLWDQASTLRLEHPGFPKKALAYHTITDTWVEIGDTPAAPVTTTAVRWGERYVLPTGEVQPGIRTNQVWSIAPVSRKHSFGAINFSVLSLYLLSMVGVGVYFSRGNKNTDDYFRGGKQVVWWAAGCSIFATMLSSITFMAIPAKAYAQDLVYMVGNFMILIVAPIAVYLALPFFRAIDATSAYEYLEKRFSRAVRLFASFLFVLFHLFRMGIVMSLAALTLSTITPLSPALCVVIMGVLSILYSALGGVEAVIWTDTIQTFVLLGGAVVCLAIMLLGSDGTPAELMQTALSDGKLHLANWHLDASSTSLALWVIIIGGIGQNISTYTADQAVVQRYMTTPDERRAANSIWFAAILAMPASILFFLMGTSLYLFYKSNPAQLDPQFTTDQILPLFIANELPLGVAGLLVAGIFAAAQSTVSTSMNSTATAVVTDFLRPFNLLRSEGAYLQAAKLLTVTLGALGTGIALFFVSPDIRSLFDQFISVVGIFMGVLGGLFALGILTRRASATGALCGVVTGACVMGLLQHSSNISGYLYAAIGIGVCYSTGYLVSLASPCKRDLSGLTLYT